MKTTKTSPNSALQPTSKKIELKAPVKGTKVNMPRLAANHNETLLIK